jgi:hypothetical protein
MSYGHWRRAWTPTDDTEVLFERRSNSPGYALELVQVRYLVSGGRARAETRTKFQDKIRMRFGEKRGWSRISRQAS